MPGPTVKPSSIKLKPVKAQARIKKPVTSSLPSPGGSLAAPAAIVNKWKALATEQTAGGQPVKSYLGFALELVSFAGGAGQAVYFERGMIVLRPDRQVFVVYGMIYLRYRALGDVQPTGWSPGLPTSDEEAVPGGRCSHFDGADIYWSAATGAHEVHGAIRDRWTALGGCNGWVGFPITDESPVTHNGAEIGRMNQFQNASIYWSPASGAWELHGALRKAWLERFGGPAGPLGWPVSNETPSPAGTYRYNDFQNGCLVWRASDGFIQSFTSLDVYVDRFSSQGEHTVGEHFGASIWLWVSSSITATTGQSASPRFPASDNYGNPNASPQASVLTIPVVRGSLVINTSFTGFDHSPIQGDQNLGTVTGRFTIDQLWAVNQPQAGWDSSSSFFVEFSVRNLTPADPMDPHFRQDLWWSWENVGTPKLSRAQYSQTFVDVELGESGFFHPFDELFYDLVYQGIAAGGNCYGMCLEANDTLARRSVYSEPLGGVPKNAASMNEVNIKQGYQLGESVINYVVGKFLTGGTHDPVRAFNESRAMYDSGDYPILSLTSAFIGGDGHAVRPYAWDQSNPNDWIIYVANPNCPASGSPDNAPQNVIHVDPHANTFTFHFGSSDTWTGGAWTGGRMFAMPFSIMCTEQQTPFWDVMLALLGLSFIVLGGDAQTLQITDDHGRTFYSPTLTGPPTLWSDIAPDGPSRIPGMARIGLSSSPKLTTARAAAAGLEAADVAAVSPAARLTGRTIAGSVAGRLPSLLLKPPAELYQLPVADPFGTPPGQLSAVETSRLSASRGSGGRARDSDRSGRQPLRQAQSARPRGRQWLRASPERGSPTRSRRLRGRGRPGR